MGPLDSEQRSGLVAAVAAVAVFVGLVVLVVVVGVGKPVSAPTTPTPTISVPVGPTVPPPVTPPLSPTTAPPTSAPVHPPKVPRPIGLHATAVRLVHANLKISERDAYFRADLAAIVARQPDFVSLNEVNSRSDATITPAGYAMYRAPLSQAPFRSPARETAVLWRTDRWTAVREGTLRITHPVRGDFKPLDQRYATWVVLRANDGAGLISVVSVHAMINPRLDTRPTAPLRKAEDLRGFTTLAGLAADLERFGPVLVAGDMNNQFPRDGGPGNYWGPKVPMAQRGMIPTFQTLGPAPQGWATHDGGGTIDWVFYSAGTITPTAEATFPQYSDHRGVQTDFTTPPLPSLRRRR